MKKGSTSRPIILALLLIPSLLVLTALGLILFLSSPAGLELLLDSDAAKGAGISVQAVEGSLLGQLHLSGIRYEGQGTILRIEEFRIRWSPGQLLSGKLHIGSIRADDIAVTLLGTGEEGQKGTEGKEDEGPLTLPDLHPALSVGVDELVLTGIRVERGEGAEKGGKTDSILKITKLSASARLEGDGLFRLARFELSMPGLSASASGHLRPQGAYPLLLNLDWKAKVPTRGEEGGGPLVISGTGSIEGDATKVMLTQAVSGHLDGELRAEAEQLLEDPRWGLEAEVKRASRQALSALLLASGLDEEKSRQILGGLASGLHLYIQAQGDPKGVEARAELHAKGEAGPSGPESPEHGALSLKAQGRYDLCQGGFDIEAGWQGLFWPLGRKGALISERGKLDLSGSPEEYSFSLATRLSARLPSARVPSAGVSESGLLEADISARGRGGLDRMEIDRLHVELPRGEIDAKARLAWGTRFGWQAEVTASGLDPAIFIEEYPGDLAIGLKSSGSLALGPRSVSRPDSEDRIDVEIEEIGGSLRGRPVSGSGRIGLSGRELLEDIRIEGLELTCGSAALRVSGRARKELSLEWSVSIADAGDLMAGASGSLTGRGRIGGRRSAPSIDANIEARSLRLSGMSIEGLDAEARLFLDDTFLDNTGASMIRAEATGLSISGHGIEGLTLRADGRISDHDVSIELRHEAGSGRLHAARCAFDPKGLHWSGLIDTLHIALHELGRWDLERAVPLELSPGQMDLPPLCLQASDGKGGSICARAHWHEDGKGAASIQIAALGLDRFQGLFPPDITKVTGVIDGRIEAALSPRPTAELHLGLGPGRIEWQADEKRLVRLTHQGGRIDASLDRSRLSGAFKLRMGEDGIRGEMELPADALENGPLLDAPLRGQVELKMRQLGLLTAMVPTLRETEGTISAHFLVSGTLGAPRLSGKAILDTKGPELLMAGIRIDRTFFEVVADGGNLLNMNGYLQQGGQRLELTGSLLLSSSKGWPVQMRIAGNRFKILDIPDASVLVSPGLLLSHALSDGLKVRGTIEIPEADIRPQQLPPDVKRPSNDVIIVSSGNPEGSQKGVSVDAKVTIALGEQIHFNGFGLDCYITGRLTITALPEKEPTAHGEIRIKRGVFHFYGHDLTIKKGIVSWAGGSLDNPGINILAVRPVQGTEVGVRVTGHAADLDVRGYSTDPSISSQDALTMLITGKSKHDPGFSQAAANTATVAGADLLAQQLRGYTGLDYLNVKAAGENASETRVFAGKDVGERLVVGIEAGTDEDGTQFVARYRLWKGLEVEVKSGAARSGVSLMYTIELR